MDTPQSLACERVLQVSVRISSPVEELFMFCSCRYRVSSRVAFSLGEPLSYCLHHVIYRYSTRTAQATAHILIKFRAMTPTGPVPHPAEGLSVVYFSYFLIFSRSCLPTSPPPYLLDFSFFLFFFSILDPTRIEEPIAIPTL